MLGELEHLPQDLDSLIFNSLSRKMTGVEDCTCADTCWNIFPLLGLWAMPVTWIIVGPRHVSEHEGLLNRETLLPLFRNFLIWCSGPDQTISCWFPSQNLFFFNGHWPGLTNPRDISDSFNGTPLPRKLVWLQLEDAGTVKRFPQILVGSLMFHDHALEMRRLVLGLVVNLFRLLQLLSRRNLPVQQSSQLKKMISPIMRIRKNSTPSMQIATLPIPIKFQTYIIFPFNFTPQLFNHFRHHCCLAESSLLPAAISRPHRY